MSLCIKRHVQDNDAEVCQKLRVLNVANSKQWLCPVSFLSKTGLLTFIRCHHFVIKLMKIDLEDVFVTKAC